jgi:hypothetical protein
MRPPAVAVDFGTPDSPRTSSDFEEVPYPSNHWASRQEEELPLHYMNEDKARRRVAKSPGGAGGFDTMATSQLEAYDDDGKDVYNKMKPNTNRVGSGRLRQGPPLPTTSIVCLVITHYMQAQLTRILERISLAEPRACASCCIHSPLMLDSVPQNRAREPRCLGRSSLWKIRIALSET